MRDAILNLMERTYGGRSWLIVSDVLAGTNGLRKRLESLGATNVFCLGATRGSGDLPDEPRALIDLPREGSMMDSLHAALASFQNLPHEIQAAIDAWDPSREAKAILPIWEDGRPKVAGRPVWALRDPRWVALEDKTVIDAFWDAAGIPRAPSRNVAAIRQALGSAAKELDRGHGTVWVGDSKGGFNGGAEYLRWVRTAADAEDATEFLSQRCDIVRVMPFLEGIPCSIHGIVFPSGEVVALRPCEMMVLRRPGQSRLHYARAGTFWDPRPEDRQAMIEAARRAGRHLFRTVDFRGVFTVDGVMSRDGFLPTELNPRFGAAIGVLAAGLDLPLSLLHRAVCEGCTEDIDPFELEEYLVAAADAERSASAIAGVARPVLEERDGLLARDESGWRWAEADGEPHATVRLGQSGSGGYLAVEFVAEHTPTGPPTAPLAASVLMFLDQEWDLGIGQLESAEQVR